MQRLFQFQRFVALEATSDRTMYLDTVRCVVAVYVSGILAGVQLASQHANNDGPQCGMCICLAELIFVDQWLDLVPIVIHGHACFHCHVLRILLQRHTVTASVHVDLGQHTILAVQGLGYHMFLFF